MFLSKNRWKWVAFLEKWVGVGESGWEWLGVGKSGWEWLGVGESGWEPVVNESSDHDQLASMTYLQKVLDKIEEQYEKV